MAAGVVESALLRDEPTAKGPWSCIKVSPSSARGWVGVKF